MKPSFSKTKFITNTNENLEDFKEIDSELETSNKCPKCGYEYD